MTVHGRSDLARLDNGLLLALCVWGESRGEPVEGQIAVACVVRNRVIRTAHDWKAVILAPWQFSCFNEDDPNFLRIVRAANILLVGMKDAPLKQAVWVADGVLANQVIDNTRGSQNYLTTALLQSERAPTWAVNRPILAVVGGHSFLTA